MKDASVKYPPHSGPVMPPKATEMTFASYEEAQHLQSYDPKRYKVIYSYKTHSYMLEERPNNG